MRLACNPKGFFSSTVSTYQSILVCLFSYHDPIQSDLRVLFNNSGLHCAYLSLKLVGSMYVSLFMGESEKQGGCSGDTTVNILEIGDILTICQPFSGS